MNRQDQIKDSRFPVSIFFVFLIILLLMSGIHYGIIVLGEKKHWHYMVQILLPMGYWTLVAGGLTLFTRWKIRRHYEEPVLRLRKAAEKVANGDFSVYVPLLHTREKWDYLDAMILDFDKMVEELGSVEVLKTDFFSNVSHEMKTPLAVIQTHAEMLQMKELSEQERRECTETILRSSRRMSGLIMNMLKLNKLERQVIRPEPVRFDLCAQLSECAIRMEHLWEEKNIELGANLDNRVFIYGDPELLELVWTNLLSNAVKFTPAGGEIGLSLSADKENAVVRIRDTGCGMSRETAAHIFDKFYQGDTSHAAEGNGLGLALVQRILDLSDGTVTVKSELGEGSVFTVRLPAAGCRKMN